MKRTMLAAILTGGVVMGSVALGGVTASRALAGETEFRACAAGLSMPAREILLAVAPKLIRPGVDARAALRSTVRSMVMSGRIRRAEARASAEAAVRCLRMVEP